MRDGEGVKARTQDAILAHYFPLLDSRRKQNQRGQSRDGGRGKNCVKKCWVQKSAENCERRVWSSESFVVERLAGVRTERQLDSVRGVSSSGKAEQDHRHLEEGVRQWLEPLAASTSHRKCWLCRQEPLGWFACVFGASVDLSLFVVREPLGEAGLDKDRAKTTPL